MEDGLGQPTLDAAGWESLSKVLFELRDALNELSVLVKDHKADTDWESGGKSQLLMQEYLKRITQLQRK